MWSLFRNPLISLLMRLWWLPTLVLLILGLGFGGQYGASIVQYMGFTVAAFITGILSSALIIGILKSWRMRMERESLEQRFLCPGCLNFGLFEYACDGCGCSVEPLLVHSGGALVTKCAHCNRALFTDKDPEGRLIKARCNICDMRSDREIYHNRVVRIFATMTSKDFITLSENTGAEIRGSQGGIKYLMRDDGRTLTFVMNLGDLDQVVTPDITTHALRDISFIWTDCSDVDPLELGQSVDAMLMRARLPDRRWRAVSVSVRQPQIDSASRHVLETRFGHINCGISPTDFMQGRRLILSVVDSGHFTAVRS